ncbi:MAG: glycosyltransferase [Xenococcaceae cyanobacterium MO_188.B29]|nr:glycosyltransferase [Xenococcaceae cyanobacterium MO_188.B29]
MQTPWLSVLIPTYNGEAYLASALDSILIQGDDEIECIIVDDGSSDSTLAIAKSYQDKLPLTVIQRKRQSNWVTNTNYALALAEGEYVCFLHQDDLWLKNRLSTMKRVIEEYPTVNLFLHSSLFIDSDGNSLGLWQCPLPKYPQVVDPSLAIEHLLIQNFIAIAAPIFKRDVALEVGRLDENLWYTADWDFWLKIASSGQTLYYPQPLTSFRVHPNSQTVMRSSSQTEFKQQMQLVVEKHLLGWQVDRNRKQQTSEVAFFSTEVNTTLAAMIHRQQTNMSQLVCSFVSLGPHGWHRYIRDSRIQERVSARLKAKLKVKSVSS